jgi:acetoin utilization deacetylase AcuC-like enzyme
LALLYFHHRSSLAHDPGVLSPDHPEGRGRIEAIEAAIATIGRSGIERRQAPAATESELGLVHTPEHIRLIGELSASGPAQIDTDTFMSEGSYEGALHAAGGACAMVRALVGGDASAGFCGLRPPGHHADRARAMGFCLFNNVAIAAELAIAELDVARVWILDWDVHHGNGTAEIFRRRRDVLFASIHEADLFPQTGKLTDSGSGEGRGYTINIPVPRRSGEEIWLSVLEHVIIPVALEFDPGLVLVSAGFDAHRDDPVGGCLLESESFAQMACQVRDVAAELAAPVGAVLEGGYDPTALGESVAATVAALDGEGEAESIAPEQLVTPRAAGHVGQFWAL